MIKSLSLIFLGGGFGAVFRGLFYFYFLGNGFYQNLVPNLIGCFLIGWVSQLSVFEQHPFRMLFILGFLGGLTTFSGYIAHLGSGEVLSLKTLLYFFLHNVLGLLAFALGQKLGLL